MLQLGIRLIMPIIKAKEPSPGTLNTGLIILFSNLPKKGTTEVYPKRFVAIKNGSNEGTTEFAQRERP